MEFIENGVKYEDSLKERVNETLNLIIIVDNKVNNKEYSNKLITEEVINSLTGTVYYFIKSFYVKYNNDEYSNLDEYIICLKSIIKILVIKYFRDNEYKFYFEE